MSRINLFVLFVLLLCFSYCSPQPDNQHDTATPPPNWVNDRVSQAQERLESTPAGQKIWEAMEAHGGLKHWFSNGPIKFHFNYMPLDGSSPRNTRQVVNQWSAQSRHQMANDSTIQFGWDGEQAWATDTAKVPFDARFWSLTPYFFVSMPFVLGDEGIHLEEAGEDTYQEKNYDLVKVTFDQGVGDAPDDYYILYLNQDTHRVEVIRYIVSYPDFFPEGGHAPEKFMAIQGWQEVKGISLPTAYKTYWWKDDQPGEHITNIDVSEVDFLPETPQGYFSVPQDASVLKKN